MTRSPPRRPPRNAGLYTILDYLADSAEFSNDTLVGLIHRTDQLAMALDDLNAANARTDQRLADLGDAISTELAQVRDLLAQIADQASHGATPAQIEALTTQANARADRIDQLLASLRADDPASPPANPPATGGG